MTNEFTGLLVGAGSIGRRHGKFMAERYGRLVVVDPNPSSCDWVMSNLGGGVVAVPTLEEGLAAIGSSKSIAVIATIGPLHHTQVEQVVEHGIRHVYCEKPITTSIADAYNLAELVASTGTRLTVGIQRRFNGLAQQIRHFATTYLGGEPVSIIGHGGAHCLVTTGMHWVDLAVDLFDEFPSCVSGSGSTDLINPRGTHLDFWQGVAVWKFSQGRMLSLNYSNHTSVDGYLHIYCPQGRIDICPDGSVRGYSRDKREIEQDPRITRTGDVTEVPNAVFVAPSTHPFVRALEELESESLLSYSVHDAVRSLESTLAALIAIETGCMTQLPIEKSGGYYTRTWAVT